MPPVGEGSHELVPAHLTSWKAIDGVRTVGNCGAPMEEYIDLIVEVEDQEAGMLVGQVEISAEYRYVDRHDKE